MGPAGVLVLADLPSTVLAPGARICAMSRAPHVGRAHQARDLVAADALALALQRVPQLAGAVPAAVVLVHGFHDWDQALVGDGPGARRPLLDGVVGARGDRQVVVP